MSRAFYFILNFKVALILIMMEELAGILPLVPLAQGGAKRGVVEEIIVRLMPAGEPAKKELLALTLLFASLAFDNEEDQKWLRRRFAMLKDILRDTPAYKQILEEGLEEGRSEGISQERQERLQSLSQAILALIQKRYPGLTKLAQGQTIIIEQPKTLEGLLVQVAQATTVEEAQSALLRWEEQS